MNCMGGGVLPGTFIVITREGLKTRDGLAFLGVTKVVGGLLENSQAHPGCTESYTQLVLGRSRSYNRKTALWILTPHPVLPIWLRQEPFCERHVAGPVA